MYPAAVWFAEIIFSIGRYREVMAFLKDKNAIAAHVSHVNLYSDEHPRGKKIKRGTPVRLWRQARAESFAEMAEFITRQQIVVQVTMTELFARELFVAAFRAKPERTMQYLGTGEGDPSIRIKRVLSATTLEALQGELIRQAAARAADCAPTRLIDRISDLAGVKPSPGLAGSYQTLVLLRNKLVHEDFGMTVASSDVEDGSDTCERFLRFCESGAERLKLPVDPIPL